MADESGRAWTHASTAAPGQKRKIGKTVLPNLEGFVDGFYEWLAAQPFKEDFFTDERQVEKVKKLQIEYWGKFFEADTDDDFVESPTRTTLTTWEG